MSGEAGPGTLEHLLREFADKWEATADEATEDPESPFDAAIDKGFRAGVRASAVALRALLDMLHNPESPVTMLPMAEPDEYDVDDEDAGDYDDGSDLDLCNHCPHDNTRHRGDGCLDCDCAVPQ